MFTNQSLGARKAKVSPSRERCSTNYILVDFGYVIEPPPPKKKNLSFGI